MRQAGDKSFAETLNNIREGQQTEDDVDLLRTRLVEKQDLAQLAETTHILYYRKSVLEHNMNAYTRCTKHKVQM